MSFNDSQVGKSDTQRDNPFAGVNAAFDEFGVTHGIEQGKDLLLGGSIKPIDNPKRNIAGLDTATESLMNQREQQANRTPEQIAAEMQNGVQQDSGAAFKDQGLLSQAQGGSNPMSGAIQARQQKAYLRDVNGIKRQAEYQAPLMKQQQMQAVMQDKISRANAAAGIADRDRQQQLANWQQQNNATNARRSVVNGLFGGGAAILGGYAGRNNSNPNASSPYSGPSEYGSGSSNDAGAGNGEDVSNEA